MSGRLRSIVTAGAIAGVTLMLYATRLGPPPPLSSDESAFHAQAQSIASNGGRDTTGRLTPLFVQVSDELWLQPIPVYTTAAVLAVTSTGEWGSRLSTVRPVVLGAILIYFIARRLFRRDWLAITCSALFALTPALFAHARIVGDTPYPLPFVLAWLYCLLAYTDRPRAWLLVIAGLALGLGVYTQPAAPVTMAFLAVITVPALRASGRMTMRTMAMFGGGFVLPILIMLPWFLSQPESYRDTMGRWAIMQAHIRFPLDGVRAFVNWSTLSQRASLYWGFFDPSWLFFAAPESSGVLRGAAPLLWPMAVLVPLGISQALKGGGSPTAIALIGGLVIAPMAAATLGVGHNIGQAMTVVPFVVLLAGFGLTRVLSASLVWRTIGLGLLAIAPIQFAYFYARDFAGV